MHDQLIKTVLRYYPGTIAIYVFGSWGTDDQRPDSDLDIALLLPHHDSVDPNHWVDLATEIVLSGKIPDVDLIDLKRAGSVLQQEVIMTGRRIYSADNDLVDEFEMHALSLYVKFEEERADIVRNFRQTGKAWLL